MKVHGIVNCDTVRKARAWLEAHGVDYTFIDFRKSPPSQAQLAAWARAAGWETLLNRRGTTWRRLDDATRERVVDERSAVALMHAQPTVIRRPVVETSDGLVVGFDPSEWQTRFSRGGASRAAR